MAAMDTSFPRATSVGGAPRGNPLTRAELSNFAAAGGVAGILASMQNREPIVTAHDSTARAGSPRQTNELNQLTNYLTN